ncbi:MAG TPA: PrgI family protein [Candidatus Saccharimonadales bacterium]|nr:PrgI family protein [Candidatus Saccharimonadales bacterium]
MSTYKVIQDIEAEDHILGPLSLRQFIYGLIALFCFYLCYLFIAKHVAFLCALFLPQGLFTAFFAIPFGQDQPTELWALAKIRFFLKPRRRIWDQSGVKELVTVTAPKKVEERRTNGLSQTEVQSRLNALANTIDSRGWAIKNVNVNLNAVGAGPAMDNSDRLVDMSSIPQPVPDYDVQASDDILDEQNNPIAQQFQQMINSSEQAHRQKLQDMMSGNAPVSPQAVPASPTDNGVTPDYWFMQAPVAAPVPTQLVAPATPVANLPDPTPEEQAIAARAKQAHEQPDLSLGHLKTIQPIDHNKPVAPPAATTPPAPNPAAFLAHDNDKSIDVIAREAKRINHQDENGDGEVVISLH